MGKLDDYLTIVQSDYGNVFDAIDHDIEFADKEINLRFQFLKFDGNGNPKLDLLIEVLEGYITQYCFSAQKRDMSGLGDTEREIAQNRLQGQARRLFRGTDTSGEAGEMLLYFLIESVLKAPQVVAKMDLKTNRNMELHGSDGIHISFSDDDKLYVYFGEAKIYQQISSALESACNSILDFHAEGSRDHELKMVTTHYKYLKDDEKAKVYEFVRDEIGSHEHVIHHACLIGYDWSRYQKLNRPGEREDFIRNFCTFYQNDFQRIADLLENKFPDGLISYRFEVFFLPFFCVQEFRDKFNEIL